MKENKSLEDVKDPKMETIYYVPMKIMIKIAANVYPIDRKGFCPAFLESIEH